MLYRAPSYPRRVRDTDLLRSAASGELSCLEALVRGVIDQVFPFAYALTGDYNHAQDLSIEIAARVSGCIRRMSNFDNFDLWIYRLTINGAAESRQGRGKKLSRIRSEGKGRVGISSKTVLDALDVLRPAEREVFVLEKFEGLGIHEIAVVMGCAQVSVRWLLHAARSRIRSHVERELPE